MAIKPFEELLDDAALEVLRQDGWTAQMLSQPLIKTFPAFHEAREKAAIIAKILFNPGERDTENYLNAHARLWHQEALRLAKKHNEKTFYN